MVAVKQIRQHKADLKNQELRCCEVKNRISIVIVSVLASGVVDRRFEPDRVKPKTFKEVFAASPQRMLCISGIMVRILALNTVNSEFVSQLGQSKDYYPVANEVVKGYIVTLPSVLPSVRPSVRPSVTSL